MKYAIIALAGRQFVVKEGDTLQVTRQAELADEVLFYKNDAGVKVGTPYVQDVQVELEKVEDKKAKKVVIARFRAKSRHRRKVGHRQPISVVKVKSIQEK
ncbi:50S ribosomal protein L21 [Patescibacteria group bacterium]|nr:50S ribosomal protein L21 [Patescibacteria group bacterium]MBU1970443.1 50S ribosomal protein L21 [Patescibacteria group bacterium]